MGVGLTARPLGKVKIPGTCLRTLAKCLAGEVARAPTNRLLESCRGIHLGKMPQRNSSGYFPCYLMVYDRSKA